ncbi:enterotoxin A family protein [Paraburkholderia sp. BCC1876]|uniref:enterotoxin A family protein n=1 Tax=Paraburkholderia sp. BCC1876 TaxID=2676303 RepID=UPI0015916286|nr:enterotoxin A family protein [Paraburkholderia sp. BCC1876]
MRISASVGALCVLLFCAVGNVVAQPAQIPDLVYRADTRTPNEVRRAGGFVARGVDTSRPGTIANMSLFNHATGHAGPDNDYSGYVATSSDFIRAYRWLWDHGGGFRTGYVYTIRPTANFIDVNASLGRFLDPVLRAENEWAAMGRIHWYQVVGWRSAAEAPSTPMTPNPQYNPNHIAFTLPPPGSQPQLAHFPVGHAAWNEMPWTEYTSCGRLSTPAARQAARSAADQCIPFENGAMDHDYYTGYLAALSSTACGGPCLEGERSANQEADFYATVNIIVDGAGHGYCNGSWEEMPESIADIYKESLCARMDVGDKFRTRGGYLLKSADSSCMIIYNRDTELTNGEICTTSKHPIHMTNSPVPGCPTGYQLVTAEDIEKDSSICSTHLELHSFARLAGKNVVSGSENVPCVITKSTNQTETSLCKKISRVTSEVVVSSESPQGSACWGNYSPVNVRQAMAHQSELCSMLSHSAGGVREIGLADGWFSTVTCNVWQGTLQRKPALTFCNNGIGQGNKFLSTTKVAKGGETCPAGFELMPEWELLADPRICWEALPPGSTARLANAASVTVPGPNETNQRCTTKESDPSTLTMAVCKAVRPVH